MLAPTLPDLNSQRPQEVRKEKTTSVGVIQDKLTVNPSFPLPTGSYDQQMCYGASGSPKSDCHAVSQKTQNAVYIMLRWCCAVPTSNHAL